MYVACIPPLAELVENQFMQSVSEIMFVLSCSFISCLMRGGMYGSVR